ncbi:MAG: MMPL family transporter [Chloroflexi bacterium]|nr:MMPL family transporter [Chloroflexota bacterium]
MTLSGLSPEALARSSAAHPWRTVLIWVVVLIIGFFLISNLLGSALTVEGQFTNDPDSKVAQELIEDRIRPTRAQETAVITSETLTVDDPVFRAVVEDFTAQVRGLGDKILNVENDELQIANFYETGIEQFVSPDRSTTLVPLTLAGDLQEATKNVKEVLKIGGDLSEASADIEISITGAAAISADFAEVAEGDLIKGELIGITIALIILLFVFRTAGSAWIPIVTSLISIFLAIAVVAVLGQIGRFSFFVTNIITMIGLAVGIDYSLFIVARFREERARGLEKLDAIAKAGATATRSVVFSGITVVFALLGMVIVPTTVFFSLGAGAVIVTIIAVLAALTFLPAMLSLVGDKVNAWKLPFIGKSAGTFEDHRGGFWNTVTKIVMGHPWPAIIIFGGLLVALTIPYFGIKTGQAGIDTLPKDFRSLQAFNILRAEFPTQVGGVSAADVVIDGDLDDPEIRAGIDRLIASLVGHPVFADPDPAIQTQTDGVLGSTVEVIHIKIAMPVDSATPLATDAIHDLREIFIPAANIPANVYVGGQAAINEDFFNLADRWTPIVISMVLALSFIFLTVVFRSIVVPIKAIVLNLLSVGAAYGLLVLVLQKGVGNEIFGFAQVETIEAWLPVFLFSILFGLSMDYEVFLLSRIRERYDQTGLNTESVAFGLRSTAGIITGAALIMVAVFGGFAVGDLVIFQEMGFGLGAAILVDATVIRAILVPATMKLLGDKNWYFPRFLEWLPDLRVEGGERSQVAPSGAEDAIATK